MKICFVGLDNYAFLRQDLGLHNMGGEAVQHGLLATQFAGLGHDVSTIVLDYGKDDSRTVSDIRLIKSYRPGAGFPGVRFFYPKLSTLWRCLKEADSDVYYQSPAGSLTGITAHFCRRYKRKFVFRIASDANCVPNEQLIRLWRDRKIYEYGLRNADIRAVQTEHQKQLLLDNYGLDSVVVNMVVEPAESIGFEDRDQDVLWVNNLRDVKRPRVALQVARALPEVSFEMIGGKSRGSGDLYDRVEKESAELSNVRFLGSKPYAYVNQRLTKSKILLNTSSLEGFPNTFLQSWIRGTPVVTTFDPDNKVQSYGLGFSTDSTEELPNLISRSLNDGLLWQRQSESARTFAVSDFSPDAVVDHYRSLFE